MELEHDFWAHDEAIGDKDSGYGSDTYNGGAGDAEANCDRLRQARLDNDADEYYETEQQEKQASAEPPAPTRHRRNPMMPQTYNKDCLIVVCTKNRTECCYPMVKDVDHPADVVMAAPLANSEGGLLKRDMTTGELLPLNYKAEVERHNSYPVDSEKPVIDRFTVPFKQIDPSYELETGHNAHTPLVAVAPSHQISNQPHLGRQNPKERADNRLARVSHSYAHCATATVTLGVLECDLVFYSRVVRDTPSSVVLQEIKSILDVLNRVPCFVAVVAVKGVDQYSKGFGKLVSLIPRPCVGMPMRISYRHSDRFFSPRVAESVRQLMGYSHEPVVIYHKNVTIRSQADTPCGDSHLVTRDNHGSGEGGETTAPCKASNDIYVGAKQRCSRREYFSVSLVIAPGDDASTDQ